VIARAVIPQAKIKDSGKRDEKKRIEKFGTTPPGKVQPGMHQGSHGRILENRNGIPGKKKIMSHSKSSFGDKFCLGKDPGSKIVGAQRVPTMNRPVNGNDHIGQGKKPQEHNHNYLKG